MFPTERLDEYRAETPVPVCATQYGHDHRPVSERNVAIKSSDGGRPRQFEPLLHRIEQRGLAGTPRAPSGKFRPDRGRTGPALGSAWQRDISVYLGTRKETS